MEEREEESKGSCNEGGKVLWRRIGGMERGGLGEAPGGGEGWEGKGRGGKGGEERRGDVLCKWDLRPWRCLFVCLCVALQCVVMSTGMHTYEFACLHAHKKMSLYTEARGVSLQFFCTFVHTRI